MNIVAASVVAPTFIQHLTATDFA